MTRRLACWAPLAFLLVLAGCGGDGSGADTGAPDGGADSGGPDAEGAVAPPDIPWLEEGLPPDLLTPCPEGWREVMDEGVAICEPYPEGGPESCDAGEAHFPGEPGCRPIGEACPSGDFATTLPSDGLIVYVNPNAAPGGDGSLGAPYRGLSDVSWFAVDSGTTVALAKGTYEGTLALKPGVRVVGACAAETVLTGTDAPVPGVVIVTALGEAPVVRNLTIRNSPQPGVWVDRGRAVRLEGVLIDGAVLAGISAVQEGTSVTLRDVVVRNARPQPSDGLHGQGIHLEELSELDAERLIVEECTALGIFVYDRAHARLTDTALRNMLTSPALGSDGQGMLAGLGGQIDAERLSIEGNRTGGLYVDGVGSAARLTDAVVQDTDIGPVPGSIAVGVGAILGGRLDAERLLVRGTHGLGVFVDGVGSTMNLTGSVIRDTQPNPRDDALGRAVSLQFGGHFNASRLVIQGNFEVGVSAKDEGTVANLEDALIRDTVPRVSDGLLGQGLTFTGGSRLDAARVVLERNHHVAIALDAEGTTATLFDIVVRDTRPIAVTDDFGRGIQLQGGAFLGGARLRVEDSRELGLAAVLQSRVDLEDVTILRTRRASCAETTCPEIQLGYGACAIDAAMRLTRFEIRDAATCGVLVGVAGGPAAGTSLDLESGTVADSVIGACIQVDDYDLDRLTNDVEYRNNESNLEATMLPVPAPFGSISG